MDNLCITQKEWKQAPVVQTVKDPDDEEIDVLVRISTSKSTPNSMSQTAHSKSGSTRVTLVIWATSNAPRCRNLCPFGLQFFSLLPDVTFPLLYRGKTNTLTLPFEGARAGRLCRRALERAHSFNGEAQSGLQLRLHRRHSAASETRAPDEERHQGWQTLYIFFQTYKYRYSHQR